MEIYVFLFILLLIIIASAFIRLPSKKSVVLPYEMNESLYTPAERSFLGVLETALDHNRYCVVGKVRLADLIRTTAGLPPSQRQTAFNRIAHKHVDFVVCEKKTWAVLAVLELDDRSHKKAKRQERDRFLDEVFQKVNIPLIRFPAQRTYALADVKFKLLETLNGYQQVEASLPR